jgi:hypothetical protein
MERCSVIIITFALLLPMAQSQETPANWAQRKSIGFEQLKRGFAEPDMIYAPFTFWFWDEPLDSAKAAHMARNMTAQRLNPGYAHARMNQAGRADLPRQQWLSPLWFKAFGDVLNEAEQAHCYFGYVDEYWWPSGRAAGRVLKQNPDLWAVSLKWETFDVAGNAVVDLPASFFTVAACLAHDAGEPKPLTESGVRPHTPAVIKSGSLRIIGKTEAFQWRVPAGGKWRVYSFTQYYHPGADGGRLNYLDEGVSKAFIELAHEPYAEQFGQAMGQSIPGVFVDNEGDYGYKLAWSDTLDRRYKDTYATDIRLGLPLMIDEDVEGSYAKIRFQWFDVVSDIYSEYLGTTSQWLEERGLYCISNLWEETLMWQAGAVGDFFKTQRAYSMPGTDCLALNALKIHDFKETQSVTEFEGRRMQSEIMGAAGFWGFSPVTIKQVANAITAWGVSHVVPHGIFMTRKLSGNPWLPDWYEYNPMWPYLHLWNDFVRRASFVNSHGHTVPELLLVSPMDSVWALSGPGAFDPANQGRVPTPPVMPLQTAGDIEQSREKLKRNSAWWCPPTMDDWFCDEVKHINRVYTQAMLDLADARIEYLIADRHYIKQMDVESGRLTRGAFSFKTVVLPPVTVLPLAVAERIVAFARSGGRVYALGELPSGSTDQGMNDPAMRALMKNLRACKRFTPCADSLKTDIQRGSPGLVSRICFKSGRFEMIQQQRRIDQRDFFWLANNTGKAQECAIVLRDIQGSAAIWDCETGQTRSVPTRTTDEGSMVDLTFGPYEAFWLVCDQTHESTAVAKPKEAKKTIAKLNGSWQVHVDAQAQPPLEHEPTIPAELLAGVQRPLQDWEKWELKRFSGYVDYTQTIELDHQSGETVLDLGRVRHLAQVWINGTDVGSRLWPPFSFDITDAVKPGTNTVKVRVGNLTNNNYGQKAESGLFGPVQIRQIETR